MAMSYMNAGTGMGASAIENTLRTLYDPWAAQQQAAGLPTSAFLSYLNPMLAPRETWGT